MDDTHISQRVRVVQTPIIPTINQLVSTHPGTISLGQGVSYYGPPAESYQAVEAQLTSSTLNAYGPVEGIPELIHSLQKKLNTRNNIAINDDQSIFVTAGSNMAFTSLMQVITDPNDEVILLTPYYFNHEMAIRLANAIPVLVPTQDNFHPDIDRIKQAITPRTRAIVTVSPNNPTGAVYTQEELTTINQLCARHNIFHINDEAYEDFVHGDNPHFSPASLTNSEAHTISLYSLSKAYGFAGWRVGYMVIPRAIFSSLRKVQDTVLISPPIVSQYAAIGAHQAPYQYIEEKIKAIKQSRSLCLDALNQTDLLAQPATSEGAFYIFARLNTHQNDFAIARALIEKHAVATIPGSAFAASNGQYLRISYGALTQQTVQQGINQLVSGLQRLLIQGTDDTTPATR